METLGAAEQAGLQAPSAISYLACPKTAIVCCIPAQSQSGMGNASTVTAEGLLATLLVYNSSCGYSRHMLRSMHALPWGWLAPGAVQCQSAPKHLLHLCRALMLRHTDSRHMTLRLRHSWMQSLLQEHTAHTVTTYCPARQCPPLTYPYTTQE